MNFLKFLYTEPGSSLLMNFENLQDIFKVYLPHRFSWQVVVNIILLYAHKLPSCLVAYDTLWMKLALILQEDVTT